jgi:hypothetical protein
LRELDNPLVLLRTCRPMGDGYGFLHSTELYADVGGN